MSMEFCGRDSEISEIVERWERANNNKNSSAQVVVIKGEPGFGKTRLAQEFFRHLSTKHDSGNHWPDTIEDVNDVNPDTKKCNYEVPIPFFWWGIRGFDPGKENAIRGDAVAAYNFDLAPGLIALKVRSKMR